MQNNSSNELSELLSVLEKELFDACSISKMLQCALSDEREFKRKLQDLLRRSGYRSN